MLNAWFGKNDMKGPVSVIPDRNSGGLVKTLAIVSPVPATPPAPPTFEEICQTADIKPPKIAYGIRKVAQMAESTHLSGMEPEFKRKALLMALEAADTDVSEVLNDVVIRQKALKEYEDVFLERVNQFETAQLTQNRMEQAELEKITALFQGRIQANLNDVALRQTEFRTWQESKRREIHNFTEAAALCVPQEKPEDEVLGSNVMLMLRPTGTFR